jgi:hypothetical protein
MREDRAHQQRSGERPQRILAEIGPDMCQGRFSVTVLGPAVSGGSGRSWSGGGLTPRPVVVRRD